MKMTYFIPSLIAAGFIPAKAAAIPIPHDGDQGKNTSLFDVLKLTHKYILAGHSSHSSHSSHASHSSHRSSTGGGFYLAPLPAPPPVEEPAPLLTLPGNSMKFKMIVMQVQNALHLFGYQVPIDGEVGDVTRSALMNFERDWNLKVTGTITPEVLEALGIAAN